MLCITDHVAGETRRNGSGQSVQTGVEQPGFETSYWIRNIVGDQFDQIRVFELSAGMLPHTMAAADTVTWGVAT